MLTRNLTAAVAGLVLAAIALPAPAAAYEWRIATAADHAGGVRCAKTEGATACYERSGDVFLGPWSKGMDSRT